MWEIYDELIAAVPPDIKIGECLIGLHWTLIRSRGMGMSLTPFGAPRMYGPKGASVAAGIGERIAGMPVRELAQYVKSWNPYEASLGLAAINSVLIRRNKWQRCMAGRCPRKARSVLRILR